MTKKITLLKTVPLLLLLGASLSEAYEVAVLKSAEIKPYIDALEGFRSSCGCETREFTYQNSDHNDLAKEVLKTKPDVVLAIGIDAFNHALLIKERPVVYAMIPSTPALGQGMQHVSGVSLDIGPEAYIRTIIEAFPWAKRIGLVYDPAKTESFVSEAATVARSKGIELIPRQALKPGEAPSLIGSLKGRIDVFWMLPDATVVSPETVDALLLFSFQNRVPVFSFSRKYVEAGAVAALSVDPFDVGAQAGEIAKKLMKSQKTPIRVRARTSSLLISRKMAEKLKIKIGDEAMKRATYVE